MRATSFPARAKIADAGRLSGSQSRRMQGTPRPA